MKAIAWALVGISGLAFLLAVVSVLIGQRVMGIPAESFSRASANMALIAIAMLVEGCKKHNE